MRENDSLCCTKVPVITEDNFEWKKCITLAHEFEWLCLNKRILKKNLVDLHKNRGDRL